MIKIVGLQYKRKYETDNDLDSLRYGKIMIMADQVYNFSLINMIQK
jgi:DNA topoisomerase-2